MKTLQNDYTTPEQSKRLLELGVPKWTANGLHCMRGIKLLEKPDKDNPNPCWTLGRLMEIFTICYPGMRSIHLTKEDMDSPLESMVDVFETGVRRYYLDFSRLNYGL